MTIERDTDERIGDAAVEAAWHAASAEEPAPQGDAAILAAARAETRADTSASPRRGAAAWWTGWQPLAAAAVAGLAFLLVQRLPTEGRTPETFQVPVEAPAPAAPVATAVPEADAVADASATAEVPAHQAVAKRRLSETPAERSSPDVGTGTSVEPPVTDERAVTVVPGAALGALPREAAEPFPREITDRVETPEGAPAQESSTPLLREQATGMAAAKSEIDAPSPEDWVHRIEVLHEAGKLSAAATELREFRRAYPDADARLPEGLRAWAKTVDTDGGR